MRLVTYRSNPSSVARLGAVVGNLVVDLGLLGDQVGQPLPSDMQSFIELGPDAVYATSEILRAHDGKWPLGAARPLANTSLLAPIPRPRKNIFAVGLNYVKHAGESTKSPDTTKGMPSQPVIFAKPPTAVIGPEGAIRHDKTVTQQLDWEVEMAVIIGTHAFGVSEAEALRYVFGYSLILDMSARDGVRMGQLMYSKGLDTYAPLGPAIVTADEIPDPQTLDLSLKVNGVVKQQSNTRNMYFKVNTLIADLSKVISLDPGDIIATGTPDGVGVGRTPQEWLWPGDVIDASLERVGSMHIPVVAA